ncbi:MAG: nucleotidyltransferase domain-containing protein [bacterium]|jgi:predicted nucleotidyltransferase|nr:nucleotidyltransferase domain-containing protein [bacterium]
MGSDSKNEYLILAKVKCRMDKNQIIKKIKENRGTLEKRFNISRIGLFGSYSTNAFHDESDVDLIYKLKEGTRLGFKEFCELEAYIKELLEVDEVDLVNHEYVNPIIEDEIDKTVIYV